MVILWGQDVICMIAFKDDLKKCKKKYCMSKYPNVLSGINIQCRSCIVRHSTSTIISWSPHAWLALYYGQRKHSELVLYSCMLVSYSDWILQSSCKSVWYKPSVRRFLFTIQYSSQSQCELDSWTFPLNFKVWIHVKHSYSILTLF